MEQPAPLGFLDVPVLLEASLPRPRFPWLWFMMGTSVAFMVAGAGMSSGTSQGTFFQFAASLLSIFIFLSLPFFMRLGLKRLRSEQNALGAAGELVHLRRWTEAAAAFGQILSRPCRTFQIRTEALVQLSTILTRYERFEDAAAVQNYLLENELVGAGTAYGLKLARAMGMLRQDHLFDADRAISELRRSGPQDSAGFALVEMYRDVKTGHPLEALTVFERKLSAMRDQLGHRLGDAYALAASAFDVLGRKEEAEDAFRRATLLQPLMEMCRRYPEVEKLLGRLTPATAPPEMA